MNENYRSFFISLIIIIFSASFAYADRKEIRIMYLNDFHGFAEPYKPFGSDEMLGGIAYLASKVNSLRSEKPSLLLAAGDMMQGNNWANLSQGESVIEFMNAMKFDAMVLGNHEFDFGQDILKKRILEASFPVLGANVEGLNGLKPYVVREISGVRIGIIGVVTENTPVSTHPRNVGGLKFIKVDETVKKYEEELQDVTDILIVLSHIGHAGDRTLAEKAKGIDIIVGGHSHTRVPSPVMVGNTIILQAWEHAKALGVLDITVEDGKIKRFYGRLEEIKPVQDGEDKDIMAIVEKYRNNVDAAMNETIGEAGVDLDGENVRTKETNLGDYIADIMKNASGADIALINGGGIRTSIKKGEVKVKDVYSVLPFDNYIVAIKLTGRQIREAIEHGVSAVEKGEGRFPQVSGLTFKYLTLSKPGERTKEILVNGKALEPDREYSVATNDFLAAGGDGYKAFGDAVKSSRDFEITGGMMKGEKLVFSDSGRWLRDIVIGYIKEKNKILPTVEGRITEAD
jgi:5'-nucleotidase/UDP-sugar diphosphatase